MTEQQRRAVVTRDVSVALAAGAGCGKTFVLSERFVSYLEPDGKSPLAELGELVAFTYTQRAARDMRDRIRRRCHQRLAVAPAEHADYWRRLVWQLDSARVSTIHSFCASLLRAHAAAAGLDPRFELLEPAALRTLTAQLVDDHLRQALGERDENLMGLVRRFGLGPLRDRLLLILSSRQRDAMDAFLNTTTEELVDDWKKRVAGAAQDLAAQLCRGPEAARVLDIIGEHGRGLNAKMRERCETLVGLLPRLAENRTPIADLKEIRVATGLQGQRAQNWPSPELYNEYKRAVTGLREDIDKIIAAVDLNPEATKLSAELGLSLVRAAADVSRALADEKRVNGRLDFDDLLAMSARLLTSGENAELRRRLAGQIRLLLVDESQDTDPAQVDLIRALCDDDMAGGKLFYVGDYKQSIYRFRGADPRVFRALASELPAAGRLPLTENFRSQPAVLDFVNALFGRAFEAYEPLVAHREQTTEPPSVEILVGESEGRLRDKGAADELRRREAKWLARRLAAMFDSEEPLVVETGADGKPQARPAKPGDVAVLFRALSNIECYEAALREAGIDYYLVGGRAFYSKQEVFDLVNLLRSVVSAADAVSLAGALRSPMFGLADETLYWLSEQPGGLAVGLFAERLPDALDSRERAAARRAARTLGELRALKDRLSITELINRALALTGYDATLLGEFLGERKLANLRKLLDKARAFDRSGLFTLADFVVQLNEFVADQPDEALAATQGETGDVVRLMTIHQAKGLEFPIVVVADIDRQGRHPAPPVALDRDWGPMVTLPERAGIEGTIPYDTYKRLTSAEEDEESVRLFYVATTRAAEYLILSAQRFIGASPQNRWTELLELRNTEISPHARWTTTEPPPVRAARRGSPQPDLLQRVAAARAAAGEGNYVIPACTRPLAPAASQPPIYSFSRLSDRLERMDASEAETDDDVPAHWSSSDDALALGDLVHRTIASLRFDEPNDVAQLVARRAEQQLIDAPRVLGTAKKLVAALLKTPLAGRLKTACRVYTEIEFLMAWPPPGASEPNLFPSGPSALIHGF
ncbi:MAG: UvrD-helicase domain-containing protein, partial [Pirellulales bacterium]